MKKNARHHPLSISIPEIYRKFRKSKGTHRPEIDRSPPQIPASPIESAKEEAKGRREAALG